MIHGFWVSFQTFICGKSYILGGRYRKWMRYFEQVVFAIIVKLCLSNDLWRYSILSKMAIGFQLFISAHWVGSTTQYTTPAIWVQVWELVPKMLCNLVMKAVTGSIHTNLARARILKGARENASVILQELPTAELPMLREQYSVHWKPCTLPGLAFPVGNPNSVWRNSFQMFWCQIRSLFRSLGKHCLLEIFKFPNSPDTLLCNQAESFKRLWKRRQYNQLMLMNQTFGQNWEKIIGACNIFLFQSYLCSFTWQHCWSYGKRPCMPRHSLSNNSDFLMASGGANPTTDHVVFCFCIAKFDIWGWI